MLELLQGLVFSMGLEIRSDQQDRGHEHESLPVGCVNWDRHYRRVRRETPLGNFENMQDV